MCDPTGASYAAIATAVISATTAAVQYDQAKESAGIQQSNLEKDEQAARLALERQEEQARQQSMADMNEANRAAVRANALFDAVAGEYGSGTSVDRQRAVASVQTGEDLATMASNRDQASSERRFAGQDLTRQVNARLASIQQPNLFGTALQIGAAAVQGYTNKRETDLARQPRTRT